MSSVMSRLSLLMVLLLVSVGTVLAAPEPTPTSSETTAFPAPQQVEGRNRCAGSVDHVMTNLTGAAGDTLEQLQAKYEDSTGFRAVVFDDTAAFVVVDPETLGAWNDRLADSGVRAAPSCVSTDLVTSASHMAASLTLGNDEWAAAG